MISVRISIQKRNSPVTVEETRELPSDWTEVLAAHRLPLLRLLLQEDIATAQVKALQLLLNLPKSLFLGLSNEQITDLCALLTWYKIENSAMPLLPYFDYNKVRYHLPNEGLENAAAIEYPFADEFLEEYMEEGSEDSLLLLVATLCREATTNQQKAVTKGDLRVPLLSRYEIEHRAKNLKGLPIEIASMVISYFVGSKLFIYDAYGDFLFKKVEEDIAGDDEPEGVRDNVEPQGEGNFLGWWGIYMDIAEGGVFGNLDKVHQTNFHTVCLHLVKKKKEADEQERKMREATKQNRL